jgi:GST-like protein
MPDWRPASENEPLSTTLANSEIAASLSIGPARTDYLCKFCKNDFHILYLIKKTKATYFPLRPIFSASEHNMIELFFWTTPNGYKPLLFLEEAGIDYRINPVNISKGEQFEPDFLKIATNNRIPAIVDHRPDDQGGALSLFESGAILEYLADKTRKFLPREGRARAEVLQWLHWQMGGIGPMFGQYLHFNDYALQDLPYAKERYSREAHRLLSVLDKHLADRPFVAHDYSIADMAIYPWVRSLIARFPGYSNVERWANAIAERPATRRAYDIGAAINRRPTVTEESKALLFGLNGDNKNGAAKTAA